MSLEIRENTKANSKAVMERRGARRKNSPFTQGSHQEHLIKLYRGAEPGKKTKDRISTPGYRGRQRPAETVPRICLEICLNPVHILRLHKAYENGRWRKL